MKTLLITCAVFVLSRLIWKWMHKPFADKFIEMDARHDLDKMP